MFNVRTIYQWLIAGDSLVISLPKIIPEMKFQGELCRLYYVNLILLYKKVYTTFADRLGGSCKPRKNKQKMCTR